MSEPICRWGILGTANIARKNWQAIRNAPGCALVAVASRDLERCRRYVAECQQHTPHDPPPQAYGSYEELLASPKVDAVYLPLPTAVRRQWAIRAAEAGKHVLSEKPVGVTTADAREIIAACRKNGVQFMDGVMFMHSRRLNRLREVLDDGQSIGAIKRIASHFTFGGSDEFFQNNIRTHSELEPLGCLGDLGWYNIRFILWVMQWKLPAKVCGHMLSGHRRTDSPAAVPTDFSAELFYPEGVSASFYCSFLADIQQWASVGGTKGSIYIPDFVLPYYGSEVAFEVQNPALQVLGCDFNMEPRARRVAVAEYSNAAENCQETNMFATFARQVLAGKPDDFWGQIAMKTQRVLDACLRSARSDEQVVELGKD